MTRIKPLNRDQAQEAIRKHFDNDLAAFGRALGSTGVYAHCPLILDAVRNLGSAIDTSGRLVAELKYLLSVRAASLVGCSL